MLTHILPNFKSTLQVAKAMIAILFSKPGESRFLSCFTSSEKGLKAFIETIKTSQKFPPRRFFGAL
jgi:hypothetical protein